jgi:parallel beta-helix repeat protein/predicted outer membrane repeat protein
MSIDKWVAKNGDNQNTGTKQDPWETIQFGVDELAKLLAAAAAGPGGRGTAVLHVVADPAPYRENVTMLGAKYSDISIVRDGPPTERTIVDGGGKTVNKHVFHIKTATGVKLDGLVIQNGVVQTVLGPDKGAGVLAQAAQVDLIGCRFEHNATISGGGFAYYECKTGKPSLVFECTVVNNIAGPDVIPLGLHAGPTLGYLALGGAGGGGAIIESENVHVQYSLFRSNTATPTGGGGLYIGKSSNVRVDDGCVFGDNHALIGAANPKWATYWEVAKGGGIYVSRCSDAPASVKIGGGRQNSFENNHAEEFGGAIAVGENSYAQIASNDIKTNRCDHEGGGISVIQQPWSEFLALQTIDPLQQEQNARTVTIENNVLFDNKAQHGGGGVYVSASSAVVLSNNQIEKNHATGGTGGGGIHVTWNSLVRLKSANNVVNNDSAAHGGGLFARNSHVRLDADNRFEKNSAVQGNGGGIYSFTGSEADAGAYDYLFELYLVRAGLLTVDVTITDRNVFEQNSAARGGGIYCEIQPLKHHWFWVPVPGSIFSFVHVTQIRIAVDIEGANHFIGNHAAAEGGGVYLTGLHQPLLAHTEFRENTSGTCGGGGYLSSCTAPEIVRSQYTGLNVATTAGGGYYLLKCDDPKIKHNRISQNKAASGRDLELKTCTASGAPLNAAFKALLIADNQPWLKPGNVKIVP